MKNALERYRKAHGLTYAELGRRVTLGRATALLHCKGERPIGGDAAILYHLGFGIPLPDLRPDLAAKITRVDTSEDQAA